MLDKTRTFDQLATERVLKARTELILVRRFYGVLVANVTPVLSHKVETMATDGTHHYFNPMFIATLTQEQLLFVQAHESEHDARRHHLRRGSRDPQKWNIATDFAINIDLKDQGFLVPEWAYCDPKYRGMSAEDIYRSRELDEKAAQQKSEQEAQEQDGDGPSDQEQQSEEPSEQEDDASGSDQEVGDDGDHQDGSDDSEGAETDDGADGSGKPEGKADGQSESGEAAGESDGSGDADGDAEADAPGPQSHGDPGRCGEVLDAAEGDDGNPPDPVEEDRKWDRIVRQAAVISRGDFPGHVTREIERLGNPGRNWRDELRAFFEQAATRIETWSRPNRRFVGRYILPGSQKEGLRKAVFLIDTSGSMDGEALRQINVEAQAAMDEGIIEDVVVLYGDTQLTRCDEYHMGDVIEFDPRGGGGTDLRPLFKHVADEIPDASLIIGFSDLFIGDAGPEPHCPVLWAVTGYPEHVKAHLANTPWGAPGIDVGAH